MMFCVAYVYNNHHHHHVPPLARISLTISRHLSLSSIAPRRSSRLYPVSAQSCCRWGLAGHPAFARPREGVHRSTSLISSSPLLQQCPVYLVRLTLIFFVMGGRWLYSCCLQTCSILVAAFLCNCRQAFSSYV